MALFRKSTIEVTPLSGKDLLLADLDGVVYAGEHGIPHAIESLTKAQAALRVAFVTNNASRTAAHVAAHLSELGVPTAPDDVVTSPQAAITILRDLVPPPATVLVVGGEGLTSVVERAGYRITDSADDQPDAVIQGFAPEVGWKQLAEAAFALAAPKPTTPLRQGDPIPANTGIPWVATNTDWTIPVARGIAPGNGTLVSAVHTAVGRLPVFAGKPEKAIFTEAFTRFGSENALMIGDRLDTDIQGAVSAGIESALVLTGIDQAKQLLAAAPNMRPTYILGDLRELHQPYPAAVRNQRTNSVRVGGAEVRMRAHVVEIVKRDGTPLNLLRAACLAIWESGLAIYGLDVPEELYL